MSAFKLLFGVAVYPEIVSSIPGSRSRFQITALQIWTIKQTKWLTDISSKYLLNSSAKDRDNSLLSLPSPGLVFISTWEWWVGFTPFPRVLAWSETQTVWTSVWTCLTKSIFNDSIHYTITPKNIHNGSERQRQMVQIDKDKWITETKTNESEIQRLVGWLDLKRDKDKWI